MKQCLEEACQELGASLDIDLSTNYVSFRVDNDDELVQRVFAACGRLGIPASTEKGGSRK